MRIRLCAIATSFLVSACSRGAVRQDSSAEPRPSPTSVPGTAYRQLCEAPFDSARVASNGCVLRDQSVRLVRPALPPKAPAPQP
jgi:hypothetical protein